jgi:glycosyltransferase involved in cell wall biosynthesis
MPNFDVQLHQAFIYDQVLALKALDQTIEIDFFFIKGKGISGYLQNLSKLKHTLLQQKYDLVHAHFALSGLLAGLQRKVPVVTTFHGSDINIPKLRLLSALAMMMSKKVIYVSQVLNQKALFRNDNKDHVIPCGLDLSIFKPYSHLEPKHLQPIPIRATPSRDLRLQPSKKHILFASSFTNPVKNYPLLQVALKLMDVSNIVVHELKSMSRVEVAEMMNKVDLCIMTSFTEGSPQFIKEAMACNCPIVSTDVGDVKEVIGKTQGCYVVDFDANELASAIQRALAFGKRTNGRDGVLKFDNQLIAKQILEIYKTMLKK